MDGSTPGLLSITNPWSLFRLMSFASVMPSNRLIYTYRNINKYSLIIYISIFPQFIVIHTVKGFGMVNKAEIDVFLELSCFFNDPVGAGNLISGSSAFPKFSLNIFKLMVHKLLKPGLENFEHYFTTV